ncbi:MAG: hypothetical protein HYR85_14200 [Planctomycetes bacterium]|nr:hypothetical protein [Planctomycetota bacterium]MBI3845141.1 hypothetical protein [Planctomycetota bacterium]
MTSSAASRAVAAVVVAASFSCRSNSSTHSAVDPISDAPVLGGADRDCLGALVEATRAFPPAGTDARAGSAWHRAADLAERSGRSSLASYLRVAATAVETRDTAGLDRAWFRTDDSPIVVVIGPSPGPPAFVHVGVRDESEDAWLSVYRERWGEFERSLPLPAGFVSTAGALDSRVVVADVVERGGTAARSTPSSTTLPLDSTLRNELGRGWVFWKNTMRDAWFATAIAPAASLVLAPDDVPFATARAHRRFYVTRFTTYGLGPQVAPSDAGPVSLEQCFGDLHDPLVIAKADLLGTLAHAWLVERRDEPREIAPEMAAMLVLMSFRALRDAIDGKAPAPHEAASRLILGWLRRERAIALDPKTDRWQIDAGRVFEAARSLVREIFEIHATGDVARARRLIDAFAHAGADIDIDRTLERLAKHANR